MEYFQTLGGSHKTVPVTYTSRTTGKICSKNEEVGSCLNEIKNHMAEQSF